MCHERKIIELMLWLSKHLVIVFKEEVFKNTNHCLQRVLCSGGTDQADAADRSNR
jgi:hypothetical protein